MITLLRIMSLICFNVTIAMAQMDPHQHSKHNMILLGEGPVFASHIVYKEPHNYQVLLQLNFDADTSAKYIAARKENPSFLFIYLLDQMNIKDVATAESISGTILYEDTSGVRHVVISNVSLAKDYFKLLYFDELPLSLAGNNPMMHKNMSAPDAIKCPNANVIQQGIECPEPTPVCDNRPGGNHYCE
jgi:hypothetical protein